MPEPPAARRLTPLKALATMLDDVRQIDVARAGDTRDTAHFWRERSSRPAIDHERSSLLAPESPKIVEG
jgi:hypothetical protein